MGSRWPPRSSTTFLPTAVLLHRTAIEVFTYLHTYITDTDPYPALQHVVNRSPRERRYRGPNHIDAQLGAGAARPSREAHTFHSSLGLGTHHRATGRRTTTRRVRLFQSCPAPSHRSYLDFGPRRTELAECGMGERAGQYVIETPESMGRYRDRLEDVELRPW